MRPRHMIWYFTIPSFSYQTVSNNNPRKQHLVCCGGGRPFPMNPYRPQVIIVQSSSVRWETLKMWHFHLRFYSIKIVNMVVLHIKMPLWVLSKSQQMNFKRISVYITSQRTIFLIYKVWQFENHQKCTSLCIFAQNFFFTRNGSVHRIQ